MVPALPTLPLKVENLLCYPDLKVTKSLLPSELNHLP